MLVSELIAKLETMPKNFHVHIGIDGHVSEIEKVIIAKSHFMPVNGDDPEEEKFILIT